MHNEPRKKMEPIRFYEETRPVGAKTIAEIARELAYGKETVRKTMVDVLHVKRIGILKGANLYDAKDVIEASRILITKKRHPKRSCKTVKDAPTQGMLEIDTTDPTIFAEVAEPVQMPQSADSMLIQISEPNRKYLRSIEMAGGSPDAFINRLIDSYRL